MTTVREALLERVPDEPRHVDLRGLLLRDDVECRPDVSGADGYVVCVPALQLACCWGDPPDEALDLVAASATRGTQIVYDETLEERVASRFEALARERIHFFALPGGADPAPRRGGEAAAVDIVEPGGNPGFAHLPDRLAAEMRDALGRTFVAMAVVEGRPVAFCYPHHETERYWDVSVDTLEAFRRRGYAADAFRGACARLRQAGKEPVWGSLESNAASMGMARALGFRPIASRRILIAAGA